MKRFSQVSYEKKLKRVLGELAFHSMRLKDLEALAKHRYGETLPDNEEGRSMLEEMLLAMRDQAHWQGEFNRLTRGDKVTENA
jgi:hypothetical protein